LYLKQLEGKMRNWVLLFFVFAVSCSQTSAPGNLEPDDIDYPDPIPITGRDRTPCNPNATAETVAVLEYLADLSEDPFSGAIVGQNCGHAGDMVIDGHIMSYGRLVEDLYEDTDKWVGILGVDYGHDRIYTLEELSAANDILIDYWNKGGLVAITWVPLNPWVNDELDLENNPGTWTDSRINNLTMAQLNEIDLDDLINPETEIHVVWRRKLDRIATALQELEDAGVVVLFKPMQEQNGFWFWWGSLSHLNDPDPYINLYRDLYTYFTEEKGLDNLLWLYSPNKNSSENLIYTKPQMWVYPGDDYIDILAPTCYNNLGMIYDYQILVDVGKPLGMAEFGPGSEGNTGNYNNLTYINSISRSFTGMAFWISWEDWENGDGTNTYMSLIGNRNASELMNHELVITRDELDW